MSDLVFVDTWGWLALGHRIERMLTIERITSARFASTWLLRKKFQDKTRISFTDLTSMALMKERGIQVVLTDDEHFEHVGMGFRKCP